MHVHATRRRSGITLTEILISILIMGVGMVSLATLFPLGLLRIREANRMVRSSVLARSAMADLGTHTLLNKPLLSKQLFLNPQTNPFRNPRFPVGSIPAQDPWLIDTPSATLSAYDGTGAPVGANSFEDDGHLGLPVAYDPLWRAAVPNPAFSTAPQNYGGYGWYLYLSPHEARFGSGIGYIRSEPSGGLPSAHGLQRLTNFSPELTPPFATGASVLYPNVNAGTAPNSTIAQIFVSPEDIVFQSNVDATGIQNQNLSPIVPDMSFNATGLAERFRVTTNDWRYTWMFTGQQVDDRGTTFEGNIVVFENRPFACDPVTNAPFQSQMPSAYQVAGETVVEAIFGYSPNVGAGGYAAGADRNILLRWPSTMPDPEVRVGSWIADVTYERSAAVSRTRFFNGNPNQPFRYPGQRCHWYQIVKRTTAADESAEIGFNNQLPSGTNYRAMTIWVSTPLKAKTQLAASGLPVYANAALVCPHVVNVFPRTFYSQ